MSINNIMYQINNSKSLMQQAKIFSEAGYCMVAGNNALPLYRFKDYGDNPKFYQELVWKCNYAYIECNCLLIVVNKNMIVLDIDSPDQIKKIGELANKYNIKSNLIVKTKNGYHIYYSVNYSVKSKNDTNNSIAIKCNNMPITAPCSYRSDKDFTYKIINSSEIPHKNNLVLLPEPMYQEIYNFNCIKQTLPTNEKKYTSPTFNTNYTNQTAEFYLNKLNVDKYLFGDRIAWLKVLSACKQLNDVNAEDSCYKWSKQGVYSDMGEWEFTAQYNSAKGVNNGNAYLISLIHRK